MATESVVLRFVAPPRIAAPEQQSATILPFRRREAPASWRDDPDFIGFYEWSFLRRESDGDWEDFKASRLEPKAQGKFASIERRHGYVSGSGAA